MIYSFLNMICGNINQLNNLFITKYEKVIIISTELKFEELNIRAELFILTTDNSILYIKEKLNSYEKNKYFN